jgi:hypothetical protein
VINLYVLLRIVVLTSGLLLLRNLLRAAKRRNAQWSLRAAGRKRAGDLALPLEAAHHLLGPSRVHGIERALGLRD